MVIDYIENSREAISNVLELIRQFSKVSGSKLNLKLLMGPSQFG